MIYQTENDEEGETRLRLLSVYADSGAGHPETIRIGQGLIGQCAADRRQILISDMPTTLHPISSGLFEATPKSIIVLPVLFEGQVKAVIELASLGHFTELQTAFLEQLTASIGIVLNSIEATMQTEGLLEQSQKLASELQTQQGELQQTNEQLEQKAAQLAERNFEVERKNQEIEQARRAVEEKASELALTSRYKSEFLANMSHELRTPLNSILILGQQLADNPEGNLVPKQIEFARTIHGAGTDLLNLISDILDLSKIESGTVTVDAEEIFFSNVLETVARPFRHQAELQGLSFDVQLDANLGRSIVTDSKRLQQILKNLLSNALKFTAQGSVRMRVVPAQTGWRSDNMALNQASSVVAFEVTDTGVGIPVEKQKIVFEAFQQADASTSRKYGGTGLGLAISRELSTLLGGELTLRSTPGIGSTFTLFLPTMYTGPRTALRTPLPGNLPLPQVALPEHLVDQFPDDRHNIQPGERSLLIVEDDPNYAGILVDAAHAAGLKAVVTARGAEALDLALQYKPVAMSLDIFLPDMLGWNVLSQFKRTLETRHIPVQILSMDEDRQQGLARGAFSYLNKPTTTEGLSAALSRINDYVKPRKKRLLIAEDNEAERFGVSELLAHPDVEIATADSGRAALDKLREQRFDCMVLDLRLPDISGFEVLEEIQKDETLADLPVVVFTGRDLSPEEDARLHTMARSIVVKGAASPERLYDETALFLHQVADDLPDDKKRMIERLHSSDEMLAGRTVLVVDDDTRNIFALSSALERRGMRVLTATTGREAIAHPRALARGGDRADGHHDAGDGRLRDDRADPRQPRAAAAADRRADRQGDEGRPREVPGSRRLRLPRQAGQHGAAFLGAAALAAPLSSPDGSVVHGQGQHPADRRSAGEAPELRGHPRRAGREPDQGDLAARGARHPAQDRGRGRRADRRGDAAARRLPARRHDPRASALPEARHHLRLGHPGRRDRPPARLRDRRRRLRDRCRSCPRCCAPRCGSSSISTARPASSRR